MTAAAPDDYSDYWTPSESTGIAFRERVPLRKRDLARALRARAGWGVSKLQLQRQSGCAEEDGEDCFTLVGEGTESIVAPYTFWSKAVTTWYFALWFVLSIGYSVTNKKARSCPTARAPTQQQ